MKCPKCRATLPPEQLVPGQRIVCAGCGQRLKLPETAATPTKTEAPSDAGYQLSAPTPAPAAGRPAVPDLLTPSAPQARPQNVAGLPKSKPAASGNQPSGGQGAAKPKGKKKKKKAKSGFPSRAVILGGGGLVAAILVVGVATWSLSGRGKSNDVAQKGDVAAAEKAAAPTENKVAAVAEKKDPVPTSGTVVVIDKPDPDAKLIELRPMSETNFAPPEKLPVVRATQALLLPVLDGAHDEFAPARWAAHPDPPTKQADPLPPEFALFVQGIPLFASGNGPYFVLHVVDRSEEIERSKDYTGLGVDEGNSMRKFVQLMDLRTGKQAGRFSWRVPLWHACRLSPEGTYVVGPNSVFSKSKPPDDGLLVAWKREAAKPAAQITMPGKVGWMDFLDDSRFAVLTYDPSPVLKVWDLAADKVVQSVALPAADFPEPKSRMEFKGRVIPLAFTPESVAGAVSPGGKYVALGGLSQIFVVGENRVVGELPWPDSIHRTKTPELHDYLSLGFSPDGRELIGVLNVDQRNFVYLGRWSTETGRVQAVFRLTEGAGKGSVYGGKPMAGPLPGTLILPDSRLGYDAVGARPGAILDASAGKVLGTLRHDTVRVLDDGASRLVYGSFERETRPDLDQKTPPWKTDPDPEKLTPAEREQWANRAKLGTAIYVAPIDSTGFAERIAAHTTGERPPVIPVDRSGLTAITPEPPSAWSPLPAQPAPLADVRSIPNVPEDRPYFGLTHVAFIDGRKKADDVEPQAGLNWHRFDLRSNPEESISVPLWPWAATPDANDVFDSAKTVLAAAMSNDGELLALRDPSNAARVDVWRATGERIGGFTPYGAKPIDWVSWSSASRLLTLGDGKLSAWDPTTGRSVYEVVGEYRLPVEPARGRRWLAISAAGHIDLVDTESGRCLGRLALGDVPADHFESLALSPDATILALCGRGDEQRCRQAPFGGFGLVRTWNLTTGQEQEPVVVQRSFNWPIFLPDNQRVLTASGTYDLASGLPAETFAFYGPLGLGPDGRLWTFEAIQSAEPAAPGRAPGKPRVLPRPQIGPNKARMNLRVVDLEKIKLDRAWLCDKRTPISVEVDLGDAQRSRQMAQHMAAWLTASRFTLGPGGFRVKGSEREVVTDMSGAHAPFLGNQPMPGIQVTWSLHGPNGVKVWSTQQVVAFNTDSKYLKSSTKTGKLVGTMEEVSLEFDFGGRNPREAILEELKEKSVKLFMHLPDARYYPPKDTPRNRGWVDLPIASQARYAN
ncbi:MAG TPA: hypothetical protein VHC22_28915 [Pirellulales bacterium]|nr:hypothetical protein [Pirellulales bacterium]